METLKNFFTGLFVIILGFIIFLIVTVGWPFIVMIGSLIVSILIAILYVVLIFFIVILIGKLVRELFQKK